MSKSALSIRVVGAALVAGVLLAAVLAAAAGLSASLAYALGLGWVTFGAYSWDTWRAVRGGRRLPERALIVLSLIGAAMGRWGGNADLAPQDAAHALLLRAGHGDDPDRRAPRSPVARRAGRAVTPDNHDGGPTNHASRTMQRPAPAKLARRRSVGFDESGAMRAFDRGGGPTDGDRACLSRGDGPGGPAWGLWGAVMSAPPPLDSPG